MKVSDATQILGVFIALGSLFFAYRSLTSSAQQLEAQLTEQEKAVSVQIVSDFLNEIGDGTINYSNGWTEDSKGNGSLAGKREAFEKLVLTRTQLLLDSIRFPSLSAQVIRFLGTNENLSHLFDASAGLKRELSGSPITSIGLDHLHLQEGNIANIKLANSSITCTDLNHANIASAELIGATISHSDLSHAVLLDTSLKNAHIQSSDLSDAVIGGERADLTGAVILFSDLQGITPVPRNTEITEEERTSMLAALLSRARSLHGSRFDAEVLRRLQDDLGQERYQQLFRDPFSPAGRKSVAQATPGMTRGQPAAAASDRESCIKER